MTASSYKPSAAVDQILPFTSDGANVRVCKELPIKHHEAAGRQALRHCRSARRDGFSKQPFGKPLLRRIAGAAPCANPGRFGVVSVIAIPAFTAHVDQDDASAPAGAVPVFAYPARPFSSDEGLSTTRTGRSSVAMRPDAPARSRSAASHLTSPACYAGHCRSARCRSRRWPCRPA